MEGEGFGQGKMFNPGSDINPFIGRKDDLEKLGALLTGPENRLVTLLGPGGIGKTRLAQELAAALQGSFRNGAIFVPLAGLTKSDDLRYALAAALNLQVSLGEDLRQALLDRLGGMQVLLVLDNFEQLLEEALFLHEILAHAGQVKILATSREKLNLQGETRYPLDGLQLPRAVEALEQADAARLFLQCARQARPGYALTPQDSAHILRICRLAQGMPLGILLAAAWMEHLSPPEIAAQMEHSLDFLAGEFRNLPERHRSLRAVFDSSYARLDEKQRTCWARLALFKGGFTAESARAVCGGEMKRLFSLAEKSLLQRNLQTGRFELHELLRQCAVEKLHSRGESEQVQALYTAHYLDFVTQSTPQLKSSGQAAVLKVLQEDWENISQAWQWALEQRNLRAIEPAIPALYAFCDMGSRYHTGKALFGLALKTLSASPEDAPFPTWGLLLLSWYDFISFHERPALKAAAQAQAQASLAYARECGSVLGEAASLVLLGALAAERSEHESALRYYQEGMRLQPELDDFYWVSLRVGICQQSNRQYPESLLSFQIGLERAQALGERVKTGWSLFNLGKTYALLGENTRSEGYLRQALEMFESIGTLAGCMMARYELAGIAQADGRTAAAQKLVREALEIAGQMHSPLWEGRLNDLLKQIGAEPGGLDKAPQAALVDPLSARELEILRLFKSDLDGPDIARELCISLNTLRFHTKNIYRKLQVTSRREAVRRAETLGL